MSKDSNRLLDRQLRRLGLDTQHPPDATNWSKLLSVIEQTYNAADQDRYTLERALSLSSKEMQKLYEEQKSSYETRLRTFFKTTQDLVWLKSSDGAYLSCNAMVENLIGASEKEIIGKTDEDLFEKNLANLFYANDRRAKEARKPTVNEEWVTFASDKRLALLETYRTPVYDTTGQYSGLFAVARDITERKQSEHQLRIAAIAFESQEGILITDENNLILRINQAFISITGYTPDEVLGKNPRMFGSDRQDSAFFADMWRSISDTGAWSGEIWNHRKNGEIYPGHLSISTVKDANGVPRNYVATLKDITESKAAAEKIKRLAFYDPLTGLPNRRLLIDRLQQALAASTRNGQRGAILFIDLDNFKAINDTLGHNMGDLLLQQVAEGLVSATRESDTVARIGGDEFVVMLEDLGEHANDAAAQTLSVCEKILISLNKTYQIATHEYHGSASIGATLFNDHHQSIDELLKQSDIAMYQAKKAGRNTLRFFDPEMQKAINYRSKLESELHKALAANQFQLYFQIQVDSSHHATGAEVLIRWLHPEHGLVTPAVFITLAEETGRILPIGRWVLETACAQLKTWERDELTRNLALSVNISAKQFSLADFVTEVQFIVQRHAINSKLLKFELTESMLLENIEVTIATMNQLKAIGIQFSLDDFGTGYSSLQYLKRLPLKQLKIDQSFVRDIATDHHDQSITRTIIAMAQNLNLDVIAEGVETEDQQKLLAAQGCRNFQGNFFSKPVPIEEFEALLKQGFAPA